MKNTIGQNISVFRKKAGMTQEELSEIMNVTSQAVSKWENDLSYPDLETVNRLSKVLGTTVDAILNGEESIPEVKVADGYNIDKRIMVLSTKVNKPVEVTANLRLPLALLYKLKANDKPDRLAELVGEERVKWVNKALEIANSGVVGTVLCAHTEEADVTIEVIEYEG